MPAFLRRDVVGAILWLVLSGTVWAISVIQALATENDAAASTKDRKSRKQRKYGGFSYVVPNDVGISPIIANGTDFSLDLRWEF